MEALSIMTGPVHQNYECGQQGDVLLFRTSSFRPEKGSILHGGVFNRELASGLAAGAVLVVAGLFLAGSIGMTAGRYVLAIAVFAVLFLFFRSFLFREPMLQAVFDRGRGVMEMKVQRIAGARQETVPLASLRGVTVEETSVEPENVDGIEVVEKIALHHGTVVAGFGERTAFYTVQLCLPDRRLTIFASRSEREAGELAAVLRQFLSLADVRQEN